MKSAPAQLKVLAYKSLGVSSNFVMGIYSNMWAIIFIGEATRTALPSWCGIQPFNQSSSLNRIQSLNPKP